MISCQYKTLNEIQLIVKGKGNVTVMGERRWSVRRAKLVHENIDATSLTGMDTFSAGFFRTSWNELLDLSDAARLIFFTNDWQLSCVFDNQKNKYLIYETMCEGIGKSYRTIKYETERYAFASKLGVISDIPEFESFIVNEKEAIWRIKP